MDAGYGVDTDLRTSITALGLSYVAGIQSHTTVWGTWQGRILCELCFETDLGLIFLIEFFSHGK
jgi:hypothetical protein